MPRLTLYGIDHTDYGRVHTVAQPDGRSAAAISVGGEYVRMRKGDLAAPNEDACCVWDEGPRTLLVVSDGHTGHWASHGLIEFLQEQPMPSDALALLRLLRSLADDGAPAADEPPNAYCTSDQSQPASFRACRAAKAPCSMPVLS